MEDFSFLFVISIHSILFHSVILTTLILRFRHCISFYSDHCSYRHCVTTFHSIWLLPIFHFFYTTIYSFRFPFHLRCSIIHSYVSTITISISIYISTDSFIYRLDHTLTCVTLMIPFCSFVHFITMFRSTFAVLPIHTTVYHRFSYRFTFLLTLTLFLFTVYLFLYFTYITDTLHWHSIYRRGLCSISEYVCCVAIHLGDPTVPHYDATEIPIYTPFIPTATTTHHLHRIHRWPYRYHVWITICLIQFHSLRYGRPTTIHSSTVISRCYHSTFCIFTPAVRFCVVTTCFVYRYRSFLLLPAYHLPFYRSCFSSIPFVVISFVPIRSTMTITFWLPPVNVYLPTTVLPLLPTILTRLHSAFLPFLSTPPVISFTICSITCRDFLRDNSSFTISTFVRCCSAFCSFGGSTISVPVFLLTFLYIFYTFFYAFITWAISCFAATIYKCHSRADSSPPPLPTTTYFTFHSEWNRDSTILSIRLFYLLHSSIPIPTVVLLPFYHLDHLTICTIDSTTWNFRWVRSYRAPMDCHLPPRACTVPFCYNAPPSPFLYGSTCSFSHYCSVPCSYIAFPIILFLHFLYFISSTVTVYHHSTVHLFDTSTLFIHGTLTIFILLPHLHATFPLPFYSPSSGRAIHVDAIVSAPFLLLHSRFLLIHDFRYCGHSRLPKEFLRWPTPSTMVLRCWCITDTVSDTLIPTVTICVGTFATFLEFHCYRRHSLPFVRSHLPPVLHYLHRHSPFLLPRTTFGGDFRLFWPLPLTCSTLHTYLIRFVVDTTIRSAIP